MEPMVRLRRKEFMHQGRVNPETYYEGCVGGDVGVGCNPETTILTTRYSAARTSLTPAL